MHSLVLESGRVGYIHVHCIVITATCANFCMYSYTPSIYICPLQLTVEGESKEKTERAHSPITAATSGDETSRKVHVHVYTCTCFNER